MPFLSESYSYLSAEIISPQISPGELPFMSFYLELKFYGYAYYQESSMVMHTIKNTWKRGLLLSWLALTNIYLFTKTSKGTYFP